MNSPQLTAPGNTELPYINSQTEYMSVLAHLLFHSRDITAEQINS